MFKLVLLITTVVTLASFASIVSKSSSVFGVDTTPQGAQIEILDRKGERIYQGETPVTTRLRHSSGFFKRATYRIKISMEGYQPRLVTVDSHLKGWYFGNLFIGGPLGMLIIDPATGAMYKLNRTIVDEKLTPVSGMGDASMQESEGLKILALKDVPAAWRGRLVRLQ